MKHPFNTVAAIALVLGTLVGCGTLQGTRAIHPGGKQVTPLSVLYAGSMTNVMEKKIRPNVDATLSVNFEGEGKGSNALAQMIQSHLSNPDIFISASPSANKTLMGSKNGDIVSWYMTLAQDQLVVAYSPQSPFHKQLQAASQGQTPWYTVLQSQGFRLGRTDPVLDPKGADTILMADLAASYYHQPHLETELLGSDENTKQVFPEEDLLAQLTSGQLDAVIAYKHEAIEWGVPYISLPRQINLGDAALADTYAKVSWQPKDGKSQIGAPIVFTITIPKTAQYPKQAAAFVQYMISGKGHQLLMKDGFSPIDIQFVGNRSSVPAQLRGFIQGASN